jgi:hypothetical protein
LKDDEIQSKFVMKGERILDEKWWEYVQNGKWNLVEMMMRDSKIDWFNVGKWSESNRNEIDDFELKSDENEIKMGMMIIVWRMMRIQSKFVKMK